MLPDINLNTTQYFLCVTCILLRKKTARRANVFLLIVQIVHSHLLMTACTVLYGVQSLLYAPPPPSATLISCVHLSAPSPVAHRNCSSRVSVFCSMKSSIWQGGAMYSVQSVLCHIFDGFSLRRSQLYCSISSERICGGVPPSLPPPRGKYSHAGTL